MENGKTLMYFFEENDYTNHEVKIWKGDMEYEGEMGLVVINNRIIEIKLSKAKEFVMAAGGRCAESKEDVFLLDGHTPAHKYENGQISAVNKAGTSIFICAKGGVAPNPDWKL